MKYITCRLCTFFPGCCVLVVVCMCYVLTNVLCGGNTAQSQCYSYDNNDVIHSAAK